MDGTIDGGEVGLEVLGTKEGNWLGGAFEGFMDGRFVGRTEMGRFVEGEIVGNLVGDPVGSDDNLTVGALVDTMEGTKEGIHVGLVVEENVGGLDGNAVEGYAEGTQ
eukprot:gene31819-36485_t